MNTSMVITSTIVYLVLWAGLRPIMRMPYRPSMEFKSKHKRFLLSSWGSWFVPAVFPPIPLLFLAAFTNFIDYQIVDDFAKLVVGQLACAGMITFLFLSLRGLSIASAMVSSVFIVFVLYLPGLIFGFWETISTIVVFGAASIGLAIKILRDTEKRHKSVRSPKHPHIQRRKMVNGGSGRGRTGH